MKSEKDVKAHVRALLKERGCWYCMPHGAGFGAAGVPDFVACVPPQGRLFAIECKFGSNVPTAHQHRQIAEIRAAGGISLVLDERNFGLLALILDELQSAT